MPDWCATTLGVLSILATSLLGRHSRRVADSSSCVMERLHSAAMCATDSLAPGQSHDIVIHPNVATLRVHSTGLTEGWLSVMERGGDVLKGLWRHHMTEAWLRF